MTLPAIVVLVTGDPVSEARARRGSFVDLLRAAAPAFGTYRWVAHDVREGGALPELAREMAVIVTGSALSVTEALPWREGVSARLRELAHAGVPLLGVCFGHQLLGHALGGRVGMNPRGREIGTTAFTLRDDDEVLGARGSFLVNNTHVDSVLELPPGARVLGHTAREAHAAVRFGAHAWGVQFHPELDGEVLGYYLAARRATLVAEGLDVDALHQELRNTPHAAHVVERFLAFASRRLG